MSLLTPTENVAARISADAQQLSAYLQNAIVLANRMASQTLTLPTDQLNEWLNARPMEQRLAEFAAHGDMGEALNDAADLAEMATGKPEGSLGRVDIRSVAEKLAAQGRELVLPEGGGFQVVEVPDVAPEPPGS